MIEVHCYMCPWCTSTSISIRSAGLSSTLLQISMLFSTLPRVWHTFSMGSSVTTMDTCGSFYLIFLKSTCGLFSLVFLKRFYSFKRMLIYSHISYIEGCYCMESIWGWFVFLLQYFFWRVITVSNRGSKIALAQKW